MQMSDDVNDGGLSRKHIMDAIDNSLRRLGTDYVDLYQIHRWDYTTPIEETMKRCTMSSRAGKARYIGASSMWAWQFAKAQYIRPIWYGWTRFVSMQNHYNAVYREEEREMNPFCVDQGVGLIPWSPLARGFLAGNRKRDDHTPTTRAKSDQFAHHMYYETHDFDVVDRVVELADSRCDTGADCAGVVAAISRASPLDHQREQNAPSGAGGRAVEIELSAEDLALSKNRIVHIRFWDTGNPYHATYNGSRIQKTLCTTDTRWSPMAEKGTIASHPLHQCYRSSNPDRTYSVEEINLLLGDWSERFGDNFGLDHVTLRRALIDAVFTAR